MIRMEAYTNEASIQDIDALLPMVQQHMTFIGTPKSLEKTRQILLQSLWPGHRTVLFVAYDEDSMPIAFAFGNAGFGLEVGEYFWINEIHVEESQRGVGHGLKFLEWIEKWLAEKNIHYIATMTSTGNAASQNLFRKNGFCVEKVMWMDKDLT